MNRLKIILLFLFAAVLTACATTQPPTQSLTETETVIRQADQIGATDYAPLEIREARQKLDRANAAYEREDYEEAARLAEQARVDAELAQMKTLSGKALLAVKELRESIQLLKDELSSGSNQ